ncbi:replication initiation protein [Bacillaceae bacterium S4-13-56]
MNADHLVTQSNDLVEARHTHPLSAREQKIVLTFVSMIQPEDEDFQKYEMYIKDFHEMLGLEGREHYTQIKDIVKNLMSKVIEIPYPNGDYLLANWTSSVKYKAGEGRIEFTFAPELKPYLLQLKRAFTSYRLSNILSLKSAYSIRLYELMKKWQHLGKWEITLESLKEKLGISKGQYKQYGHLKSRIIVPSLQELNEKTDIQVTFKEIRKGRKVDKIEFAIKHLKDKEIRLEEPKKENYDQELFEDLNDIAQFELSLSTFKKIEKTAKEIYKEDYITQLEMLMELVNFKLKHEGISSPVGFTLYYMEERKKLAEQGKDATIERISNEVVPQWFREKNRKERKQKRSEQKT